MALGLASRSARVRLLTALVALAVPLVQFGLLWESPKACPFCAAVTFASFGVGITLIRSDVVEHTLPRSFLLSGLGLGALVMAYHGSVLMGHLPGISDPRKELVRNFTDEAWRSFVRLPAGTQISNPAVILLARDGCGPCEESERELARQGVTVFVARECQGRDREPCFAEPEVITPTFLFLDPAGRVVDQQIGWPSSPEDRNGLVQRIQFLQTP